MGLLARMHMMAAHNMIEDAWMGVAAADGVNFTERAKVHVTEDATPEDIAFANHRLKRKRTQPRGSIECLAEGCTRTVSANAGLCRACREKIEAERGAEIFA